MLETLVGNRNAYYCLLFVYHYGEVYPNIIAKALQEKTVSPIQAQFRRLTEGGIFKSRKVGRATMYSFNERSSIVKHLKEMVKIEYENILPKDKERLFSIRTRPRREGKPVINGN
jgi:hypothetical protein